VEAFHGVVGGQPYLVRRGLQEMARTKMTLREFQPAAYRRGGVYGDHLRRLLIALQRDADLCDDVCRMQGLPCATDEAFSRLRSAGLVMGTRENIHFRCDLYRRYLDQHLPRGIRRPATERSAALHVRTEQ
jgi:hypothetical protein